MRWAKYRYNFAYGFGDWEYVEVSNDWEKSYESLDECLNETYHLHREYEWADTYRGFDCELVEDAPSVVIYRKLKRAREKARYYKKEVSRLEVDLMIANKKDEEEGRV